MIRMAKENITPGSKAAKTEYSAAIAMQRHHDYFVGLKRRGELPAEVKAQLNLAEQREKDGLVKPLAEEPPTEAKVG